MTTSAPATAPAQPAAGEPGRRERKKAATRQALHEAALRLTAERGLARVTVEDIAEAADVAPRTFFNYFPTKEAAVLAELAEVSRELTRRLADRPGDESPLAALTAVLVGWAERTPPEWCGLIRLVRADPHLRAASLSLWEDVQLALSQIVGERTGTDPERDLYPTLLVSAALAAQRAALSCWRQAGNRRPLPDVVREALSALAAGLPPPEARRPGERP
jgi:AcrR family transcriptional regulator